VGIRFLPLTLSVVVGSLLAGALANRLSNEVILAISLAVLAIGLGSIAPIVEGPDSVSALIPSMMAVGLGMGLFNPPRAALAVSLVPQRLGATSTGTNETAQQLGAAIGIAVFGSLYAAGGTGTAADLRMPLMIAAICAAVGAGAALAMLRAPRPLQTGDLVEFATHSMASE
jgi:MFS family permease